MSEATPPITADEAKLSRLAELDLALAEKAHAQAMAATDPDEFNGHVRSYQRVARSLRQTLALKAKTARERAKGAAEAAASRPASKPHDDELLGAAIDIRFETIQDAVTRVIDAATPDEPERREQLYERFDREADDWELDEMWLEEALDDQIAWACEKLGLPSDLAAGWRKLPKTVWAPDPVEATPNPAPAHARPWPETG